MTKVCIAEKPSVGREIANILGATKSCDGYMEGNGYAVTWVFGHLCELKEPQEYRPEWRRWDIHSLPINPQNFEIRLKGDKGCEHQFNIIKNLISTAEEVINCGDAGQEGELIQRWVMELANTRCEVKRLWISSLTEKSIRDGFNNLRSSHDFDNLYEAGRARAIGDWLLGMNATRAYTIRFGTNRQVLSIGRVQTPTLALIVSRYHEIMQFQSKDFWELKTIYRDATFTASQGRFEDKQKATDALNKVQDQPFVINNIIKKEGIETSPSLFDLTSLQVECNKRFGFSADETLRLIQSLYEQKFTTYPRVDTTYLSDDIYPQIPKIMSAMTPYANLTAPLLKAELRKSNRVFDNSKVTDHHAIIPTDVTPSTSLSRQEKLVYDLIARRFIAVFYPDSNISTTQVIGSSNGVEFKCNGKQILTQGWRVCFPQKSKDDDDKKDDEANAVLPNFEIDESGPHKPTLASKKTTPPKPYTEATLLRAMETAGKQVDDEELRQLMKDNGIGRPSTRAAIIETLFKRKYIVKTGKSLQPTPIGIQLISILKNDMLRSVELTGQWEKKLRQIEQGKYDKELFINELRQLSDMVVRQVEEDKISPRLQNIEITKAKPAKIEKPKEQMLCPICNRPILKGRTAWGCSGYREGCNFRIPFEYQGKTITETQAKVLISKGETAIIKGFSVDGHKVDGRLRLDANKNLTLEVMEAETIDISSLKCPLCNAQVVQGKSAWGCMGYKTGCTFRVPFVFMNKVITPTHLKVLTEKRMTGVIRGFVDESGSKHNGRLIIDEKGKLTIRN
ncbi:MAG: DNA topoisomerase 3 [Marinilabiliaceae bacterium]|nr:DNA topoisomerase 3 [Marinilabiliaceae bacterium]